MKNQPLAFASTLTVILFLIACASPVKLMETGRYDDAIDLAIRKLSGKSKKKLEHVQALETAFEKATSRDLRLADQLVQENRPGNWDRIYDLYRGVRFRQQKIEPLLPLVAENGYQATFKFVRTQQLEREAKEKAADFYYREAEELLTLAEEKQDRFAARTAYGYLQNVREYFRDYKNEAELSRKAQLLGTTHVLVRMENEANVILPAGFERELLSFSTGDLNAVWKQYYTNPQEAPKVDYVAMIKLVNIAVSPEMVNERQYVDYREIEDGWEYVLDGNGNVMKDSLGNDVKIPKKVLITAEILENFQQKIATVTARMELYDHQNKTLLDADNISADAIFENYAATFRGDRRALSRESLRHIGNRPVPFPPDEMLLMQAAESLKPIIKSRLYYTNFIQ
jgi:hypothetical protein